MDLEAQAVKAKIQAVRFFNDFKEVEKTANTALSNSISLQSELSTVQIDLKSLIESLQVNFDSGVQNIQNQINEVTNVIVQEQGTRKSETEALEQQIFAQEDQLQKNVKGKKAKKVAPDSFAGKMRQKLREKAKENSGMLGLLGAGAGLASLGSGGNWFTNLFNRKEENNNNTSALNVSDTKNLIEQIKENNNEENTEEITEGINTYENNEEITEGINTYENNEEKTEGIFPSFSDLKETFHTITGYNLYKQLFPNDKGLLHMLNNKKENGDEIGTNGLNSGFRHVTNTDLSGQFGISGPTGLTFGGKGGSTYGDPDYDPYSEFKLTNTTDNNSNNEVIDGGTTVIGGDTQVVDGGTVGNNQRGEVVAQVDYVKSANSPVTAVKLSESNSIKELAIGA